MKWHQAHTTWFFETFVLRPFLPDYKPFREEFRWLFNSYYNSIGEAAPEKQLRASFSRPSLDEIIAFRTHVDEAMEKLFAATIDDEAARRIVFGLNHEQQHQELMLTDIKHAFFSNPLRPAYHDAPLREARDVPPSIHVAWLPRRCNRNWLSARFDELPRLLLRQRNSPPQGVPGSLRDRKPQRHVS